jgi:intein-encoded DNA endonuclease-like protein
MKITKEFLRREYWKKNKSTWQIARECGFKNSKTIVWKMQKLGVSRRTKSQAFLLNHHRRKKFTPAWNRHLSYIVGTVLGDGNVGHYLTRLRTTTLSFNESFAESLKKVGVESKTVYNNPRESWNTYVCSVEFAKWLKNLTIDDIRNNVINNKKRMIEFIRGFYESEGSAKKWYNVVYVEMANTNKEILDLIEEFIKKLGFGCTIRRGYDKRYDSYIYRLSLLGPSQTKLKFLKLIKPVIKGKPKQYPKKLYENKVN